MGKVRELHTRGQKSIFKNQIVTVADLEELKAELILAFRGMLSEFKSQPGKKWLKSYEVKKLLGISTGTLQNLRNSGALPHTKVGGTIYYNGEDIDRMLLKSKSQPGIIKTLSRKF